MIYKLALIVLALALVLVTAIMDYSYHESGTHTEPVNQRTYQDKAPDFSFQTIGANEEHKLSDFEGKVILINFWASWCLPCVIEFPALIDLAEQYPDELVLIMPSADKTAEGATTFIRNFATKRGYIQEGEDALLSHLSNVYVVWDEKKMIAREKFQTLRYPESVIITPDLFLHNKVVGVMTDENIEQLRSYIEGLRHPSDG